MFILANRTDHSCGPRKGSRFDLRAAQFIREHRAIKIKIVSNAALCGIEKDANGGQDRLKRRHAGQILCRQASDLGNLFRDWAFWLNQLAVRVDDVVACAENGRKLDDARLVLDRRR